MEPVLNIITSYESRVSMVEELISTAYEATIASESSFGALDEERERLKSSLQKTLAKNCSLRRKDFNRLMERVLSESNGKREVIEKERGQLREKVKEYLNEQKELANCLREQIFELAQEKADKSGLDAVINNIRAAYEGTGQQLFAMLRDFQLHLDAFQREQANINHKLRGLMEQGESLSIEDLRQLEAAKAHQDRKVERELRREEVERLLAHFKQQRQESSRQRRQ
jgi:ABC-type transporter Mla subunit MlaD